MYMLPRYMSPTVLVDVLCEFDWPAPFEVKFNLPDGIVVIFPKCRLYITEVDAEVDLYFMKESTGLPERVSIVSVIAAMGKLETPNLIDIRTAVGSEDLFKDRLRNLFTILLTHFHSSLLGNFEWIPKYKAWEATWKRS